MLKQILDLLALNEHYAQSENIEIAKGKYQTVRTWKKAIKQIKRNAQWQLKK